MGRRKKEHLLQQIISLYGGAIHNTAKRLCPRGVQLADMKMDLLLKVYSWMVRKGYKVDDAPKMLTGIKHRGIDLQRTLLNHNSHYESVGVLPVRAVETVGQDDVDLSVGARVQELKALVRRDVGGLDARIVIELAWPSRRTVAYARRWPVRGKRAVLKHLRRRAPTVRKWHVAAVLGVDRRRVSAAMKHVAQVLQAGTYNLLGELNEQYEDKTTQAKRKKEE